MLLQVRCLELINLLQPKLLLGQLLLLGHFAALVFVVVSFFWLRVTFQAFAEQLLIWARLAPALQLL